MPIQLKDIDYKNSSFVRYASDMNFFLDVLNKQYDIKHFSYTRLSENKTGLVLTTHPNFSELFLKEKFYEIAFIDDINAYKTKNYLTDGLPPDKIHSALSELTSLGHGLIMVKKQPTYVEIFYFFGKLNNPTINNFYLNNTKLLDDFISYFKSKYRNQLERMKDEAIIYPNTAKDTILLDNTIQTIAVRNIDDTKLANLLCSLTTREQECLALIMAGYCNKHISQYMQISIRTVEKHVENLKKKLRIDSRYQLILKLRTIIG